MGQRPSLEMTRPSPCRVLFVNRMACLERGGGETFDLEMARHLAAMGVDITVLSGAPLFGPPPLPIPGAKVLHTPWLRRFPWDKVKGGWRVRQAEFLWFQWRAARWIAAHAGAFDLVQICELPDLVHWLKKNDVSLPLVMRLTAPNYYDPRNGLAAADALIASGESIAQLHQRGFPDAWDISNSVDPEHFKPGASDFRQQANIAANDLVLLYVARFQGFKNHAMLIRAFARFHQSHPASKLVLAGRGPLEGEVKRQVQELGLTASVIFLGDVPYDQLPAVYAAADISVITSDFESFCFAALESMASGLPVVSTRCGWVPKLVDNGPGLLVPVNDDEAFAAALDQLARDPARRRQMGEAGRQRVLDTYTWTASSRKLLELYNQLLARKP